MQKTGEGQTSNHINTSNVNTPIVRILINVHFLTIKSNSFITQVDTKASSVKNICSAKNANTKNSALLLIVIRRSLSNSWLTFRRIVNLICMSTKQSGAH